MNHEVRHIATCTCGRTIEVIVRTPQKGGNLNSPGAGNPHSFPDSKPSRKEDSGMLPEPLFEI
jgi:hypothetical protein